MLAVDKIQVAGYFTQVQLQRKWYTCIHVHPWSSWSQKCIIILIMIALFYTVHSVQAVCSVMIYMSQYSLVVNVVTEWLLWYINIVPRLYERKCAPAHVHMYTQYLPRKGQVTRTLASPQSSPCYCTDHPHVHVVFVSFFFFFFPSFLCSVVYIYKYDCLCSLTCDNAYMQAYFTYTHWRLQEIRHSWLNSTTEYLPGHETEGIHLEESFSLSPEGFVSYALLIPQHIGPSRMQLDSGTNLGESSGGIGCLLKLFCRFRDRLLLSLNPLVAHYGVSREIAWLS